MAATEQISVRRAQLADVPGLLKFLKYDRNIQDPKAFDYGEEDLRLYIDAPQCLVYVALNDDTPVGLVIAYDLVTWGYIDEICVAKDARGQGVGKLLLDQLSGDMAGRWAVTEACYDVRDEATGQYLRSQGFSGSEELVWLTKGMPKRET